MALIFVVEDDESIREIETIALKNSGHEVLAFENANDFYGKLNEILPDLLILDIMLPDSDGNTIVKKLRIMTETKMLPIIMVTAKTSEVDLIRGLDNGADDYINWYCSGYFVLQTAFNNKKLRELGYPTFTEFYLKICEN